MDPHGPAARYLRFAITLAALVGALAFGTLLAITFLVPDAVERAAQSFVRHEVTVALRAKLGEQRIELFASAAERLRRRLADESTTLRRLRDAPLEAHVHAAIGRLCRAGCEARLHPAVDGDLMWRHHAGRLVASEAAVERLESWIQGRYLETVRDLTREVRIFLACNTALFALVAALGLAGRASARALLVPAAALFAGTMAATLVYVAGQDWLYAMIHGTYAGWTYLAWCAGMALVCLDLAVTRGAFTIAVVGAVVEGLATVMGALLACCP